MAYTVGQVAKAAGVTVRTLHHYDEIGLLLAERAHARPATAGTTTRTWSGCSTSSSTGSWGSRWRRSRRSSTTRTPTRRRTCAGSTSC